MIREPIEPARNEHRDESPVFQPGSNSEGTNFDMPHVHPYKPNGALFAVFIISACSDSGPSRQDGGTDTDHGFGATATGTSTSTSESSSDATSSRDASSSTSSDSEATGWTESSGSPVPLCCSADCSLCQDDCPTETLDQSSGGLTESIAILGDRVFWASGFFAELRQYDALTGEASLLGTFDYGMHTLIANEDAVYFGSRNSAYPVIGSVDPTTGEDSVLWAFEVDGLNPGAGQLALDENYLYFSGADSSGGGDGGVFRIALDGGTPELIANTDLAPGLGLDEDHLFFTDATNARVFSLAKSDIGSEIAPTELALTLNPGELFVGEEFIYYTSSTGLDRISKDGGDFARLVETSDSVFGLTGDETHLYATTLAGDRVIRVERGTQSPQVVDIAADGDLAVAVSCEAIYWVNSDAELRRRAK